MKQTFGQQIATAVTLFCGSWGFIGTFFFIIALWVLLNSAYFTLHPFDPYPYILLNLVLSCLAAIQAPVIMISQKLQYDEDRRRDEQDFQTGQKAEEEIRDLLDVVKDLVQKLEDQPHV